jgi:hypothetical protein
MRASIALSLLAFASTCLAAPTARGEIVDPFPFDDGFPDPSPEQLAQIQLAAHGTLSNSSGPSQISNEGLTNLRLINFNERTEAVFFEQLLYNVTNNVPGFELPQHVDRQYMLDFLLVVQKTEELHNLNAVRALEKFNATGVEPCTRYNFPVSTFTEAINLATTFTSNVFGVLGDIATVFAENGDAALVRGILQAATAEGEQNGFYRYLLGKTPQELPFTTVSHRDFAFSALHSFVDPTSCPNLDVIDLKVFETITVLTPPKDVDSTIKFSLSNKNRLWEDGKDYFAVYVNQGNLPVVVPVKQVTEHEGGDIVVEAEFPYTAHLLNGLTIVSVTDNAGPFANVDEVAGNATWAPGFIVVN